MGSDSFSSLQNVFSKIAAKHGLQSQLQASHALYLTDQVLSEMFKRKEKNGFAKATELKNGCITITVGTSIQAQEITFRKLEILDALHQRGFTVKALKTRLA